MVKKYNNVRDVAGFFNGHTSQVDIKPDDFYRLDNLQQHYNDNYVGNTPIYNYNPTNGFKKEIDTTYSQTAYYNGPTEF